MIKSDVHNCYPSEIKLKLRQRGSLMTARVKVLLHAMFRETAGKREITQELNEGSTLRVVLEQLAEKYGRDFKNILNLKTGQIEADTLVMLNGQSMRKTDVPVKDGDVVMISVPIGGG